MNTPVTSQSYTVCFSIGLNRCSECGQDTTLRLKRRVDRRHRHVGCSGDRFDRGLGVVDVETAKQSGRTGFGEMLAFLKSTPGCRTILVEKTDRLYRNIKDWIVVDDLDIAVHFVKENTIISKESRSSEKFMHGIKVLMAKNYIDNLGEEVKKGMREKAEQGYWPSMAPIGM